MTAPTIHDAMNPADRRRCEDLERRAQECREKAAPFLQEAEVCRAAALRIMRPYQQKAALFGLEVCVEHARWMEAERQRDRAGVRPIIEVP